MAPSVVRSSASRTSRNGHVRRAELEHRATYDPLTGCLNRASILQVVEARMSSPSAVGLIFLDLDGFKSINDELGHASGDLVLIEAVRRIKESVRDTDAVGRLGGDEFIVVCPDCFDANGVVHMAQRIADAFTIPMLLGDGPVAMRASIGVAVANDGRTTSDVLIASADAAMYEAKRNGDGRPVTPFTEPRSVTGAKPTATGVTRADDSLP